MKRLLLLLPFALMTLSCSKEGWAMDYAEPAAQFEAADLLAKGPSFVGKKVTVKGKVTRVEVIDGTTAWVELDGGIRCEFGTFVRMAESLKVGETATVDGMLERCTAGDLLLDPAMSRDPRAPFAAQ